MKKVWKIIALTMIGTLLIGYALHEMSITKLRAKNTREREDAKTQIVKLTAYRDQLLASTTLPVIPQ